MNTPKTKLADGLLRCAESLQDALRNIDDSIALSEIHSIWLGPCVGLQTIRTVVNNAQDGLLAIFDAIEAEEESDGTALLRHLLRRVESSTNEKNA